jgi:hypothetical protein
MHYVDVRQVAASEKSLSTAVVPRTDADHRLVTEGDLTHDPESTLAGGHKLIALRVHQEQKMEATLTSQPSD